MPNIAGIFRATEIAGCKNSRRMLITFLLAGITMLAAQAETFSTNDSHLPPEAQASVIDSSNDKTSNLIQPAETLEHASKLQVGQVRGGEATYGCLGCSITLGGKIIKVFPESDLNRFSIEPKDKILGINGHKFNPFKFQKECISMPGTSIVLDLLHKGVTEEISVQRIDSRLLSSRARTYKGLSQKRFTW